MEKAEVKKPFTLTGIAGLPLHEQRLVIQDRVMPIITGVINNADGKPNVTDPFLHEQSVLNSIADKAESALADRIKIFGLPKDFPTEIWVALEKRRVKIHNSSIFLTRNVKDSNPKQNVVADAMVAALRIARNLLLTDIMDKQLGIANKHGLGDSFQPLMETVRFKTCGEPTIKIQGFSIVDFLRSKNFEMSQFLRSSVEATMARRKYSYDNILLENTDNPRVKAYPHTARQAIHNACEQFSILSVLAPEIFEEIKVPCHDDAEQEIVSKTRGVIEQALALRRNLLKTIFFPNSPDFPALSALLKEYLDQKDINIKIITLVRLGLNEPKNEIGAYRKAEILYERGEHTDLYAKLISVIEEFTRVYPQEADIFTIEETTKFLPESRVEGKGFPSFEDLKKISEQILKQSSGLKYEISPSGVDFHGVAVLKNIIVKFISKGDPTKIQFFLCEEKENFAIGINTKKEKIYWNSLKDPNAPKLQGIRNEAMLLVRSILLAVQAQVEAEYKKGQKSKAAIVNPTVLNSNGSKKDHRDIYVPRPKEAKPKPKKPLIPIPEVLLGKNANGGENEIAAENEVRHNINFPEKKNMNKLMKHVSPENQKKIIEAVNEYNETGVGILKMLDKTAMHNGKPIIELKYRKYRILMTSNGHRNGIDSDEKKQQLMIYKIIHSEDVTRSHANKYYI